MYMRHNRFFSRWLLATVVLLLSIVSLLISLGTQPAEAESCGPTYIGDMYCYSTLTRYVDGQFQTLRNGYDIYEEYYGLGYWHHTYNYNPWKSYWVSGLHTPNCPADCS